MPAEHQPGAIRDLIWYLREGDAQLGLRSSYGALVEMAMSGGGGRSPKADPGVTDRRFGQDGTVKRARAVRTALIGLPRSVQRILAAAHAPHAWPREATKTFGHLAGLALLTERARVAFRDALAAKWSTSCKELAKGGSPEDHELAVIAHRRMASAGIGEWLRGPAQVKSEGLVAAIVAEAAILLAAAEADYVAAYDARRKRRSRGGDVDIKPTRKPRAAAGVPFLPEAP